MTAGAGTDLQHLFALDLRQRHLDRRHVAAQPKHVFQRVQPLQQLFAGNVLVDAFIKGIIKGLPKRLNILLVRRDGHGFAAPWRTRLKVHDLT